MKDVENVGNTQKTIMAVGGAITHRSIMTLAKCVALKTEWVIGTTIKHTAKLCLEGWARTRCRKEKLCKHF